jgi:hypothetical protein
MTFANSDSDLNALAQSHECGLPGVGRAHNRALQAFSVFPLISGCAFAWATFGFRNRIKAGN